MVQKYWQIQLQHSKESIDFKSISQTRWDDRKKAEDSLKLILKSGTAKVSTIDTKKVSEQAPLLFDLTGLQKECNKKLNLSAEETLNIAQSLYEKQFITYPRTGSCYIPEDVWAKIPHLIKSLNDRKT
ncbi:hypothetical protein A0O34_21880 (plasmid) [Chryseobacterium glaciei]|uniref:Topo IA-type catalytic domain-containing protein n=1 Tax=Chryseobacterium glaciei TaxID=1685010 RepID=A0A172Y296_9FLAO|nr:hypothetical protein A0O34_21880 [Chryseobacterium glaciei]